MEKILLILCSHLARFDCSLQIATLFWDIILLFCENSSSFSQTYSYMLLVLRIDRIYYAKSWFNVISTNQWLSGLCTLWRRCSVIYVTIMVLHWSVLVKRIAIWHKKLHLFKNFIIKWHMYSKFTKYIPFLDHFNYLDSSLRYNTRK